METWTPPNPEYAPPKADEPPLHRAAREGDSAAMRELVAAGADVNAEFDIALDPGARPRGATPLMVAAGSGDGANEQTVRTLLEVGADPKVVIDGESPASFACSGLGWNYRPGGDATRLKLLLAVGSPLPAEADKSNMLLCNTAGTGDAARLRVLLDQGLNPGGHFDPEEARRDHLAMMRHMQEYRDSQPVPFAAMLSDGLRASMAETAKRLDQEALERHCSAPWQHDIPLFRAVESGNRECVRLLLAAGADANARDSSSRTAMYYANTLEVLHALMEAGVPIEDSDTYGSSPLDGAVSDGESALPRIRALIAAGANVNATHDRGYTVFMLAVGSDRCREVLRTLIAAGADPHAVSELGFNAFHASIDVNGGANAEESIRDTLGFLKQLGVNIELRNKAGETPLARAIQHGTGLEVRVLCELGADPNAVCPKLECSGEECTRIDLPLLFHAAGGSGVDSDVKTRALLEAGADPLIKDNEGYTPFVRVVAALCYDAADYPAAFNSFFAGLRQLKAGGASGATDRGAYVAAVSPTLREFVEKFAESIPLPGRSEYEAEWRRERINCIVLLGASQGWASRQASRQ